MRNKSRQNRNHDKNRHSVDDLDNEILGSEQPASPVRLSPPSVRSSPQLQDRRRWAPGRHALSDRADVKPPRDVTGRTARIVHKVTAPRVRRGPGGRPLASRNKFSFSTLNSATAHFADVRKTIICFKRKVRREVLFALKLKRAGKGGKKRRNEWSDVRC